MTSIAIERTKVDCLQTSISAYYYTPVRAIFVGSMIAVGLALIVYKGRSSGEDVCLNFAGMLAPVVAIAPTTDVGRCWSVPPSPRPINDDGSLAPWVVTNIDNNVNALLIAGGVGLLLAAIIAVVANDWNLKAPVEKVEPGTMRTLGATGIALFAAWWLSRYWSDFYTRAHGYAAVLMFAFLILAVLAVTFDHRTKRDKWFWFYTTVAALMLLGAFIIPTTRIFDEHTVFYLEAWEILLFAIYWGIHTAEKWGEEVEPSTELSTEPRVLKGKVVGQQKRVAGGVNPKA